MVSEKNLVNSFRLVKNDIMGFQKELLNLKKQQSEVLIRLDKLISKNEKIPNKRTKTITKVVTKTPKKTYVASKDGTKFHNLNCPFAKNIKPKTRITFKSKNTALNKGYKPCRCV